MDVSNTSIFFFEDILCNVAFKELYSSKEMITTPVYLPRLIIKISRSFVTLSRYYLVSLRKSESVVDNIITYLCTNKCTYLHMSIAHPNMRHINK
jgi:hypothetical protein